MKRSIEMGIDVFDKEIAVLNSVRDQIDDTFDKMLTEMMNCKGKVIFIGMGKSGHVAKKLQLLWHLLEHVQSVFIPVNVCMAI